MKGFPFRLTLVSFIATIAFVSIPFDHHQNRVLATLVVKRSWYSDPNCVHFTHASIYEQNKCYPSIDYPKSGDTWSCPNPLTETCATFQDFLRANCTYPIEAPRVESCNKCVPFGDLGNEMLYCDPSGKFIEKRMVCNADCSGCAVNVPMFLNDCLNTNVSTNVLRKIGSCDASIPYTIWNNVRCVNTNGFNPEKVRPNTCTPTFWPVNGTTALYYKVACVSN